MHACGTVFVVSPIHSSYLALCGVDARSLACSRVRVLLAVVRVGLVGGWVADWLLPACLPACLPAWVTDLLSRQVLSASPVQRQFCVPSSAVRHGRDLYRVLVDRFFSDQLTAAEIAAQPGVRVLPHRLLAVDVVEHPAVALSAWQTTTTHNNNSSSSRGSNGAARSASSPSFDRRSMLDTSANAELALLPWTRFRSHSQLGRLSNEARLSAMPPAWAVVGALPSSSYFQPNGRGAVGSSLSPSSLSSPVWQSSPSATTPSTRLSPTFSRDSHATTASSRGSGGGGGGGGGRGIVAVSPRALAHQGPLVVRSPTRVLHGDANLAFGLTLLLLAWLTVPPTEVWRACVGNACLVVS